MKLVTVIALWTLITTFSVSLHAEGLRLSEPVAEDASSETFGSPLDEGLTPITLGQALAEPAKYFNQTVAVETKVGKVCQKKGCFFIAQQGSNSMRVSFKDYSFFVPTNISGQTVTLVGELVTKELTAKQTQHFNNDTQGGNLEPGEVIEFVASAVKVPKA